MAERYPDTVEAPSHKAALASFDARKRLIAIADQIAESLLWFRNWKWQGSDLFFPLDPDMRLVDKYYPYAKGGPLLVDEPGDEDQAKKSYDKQKVLKKLGYRFIVVEMNPATTLFDALEQLGEL